MAPTGSFSRTSRIAPRNVRRGGKVPRLVRLRHPSFLVALAGLAVHAAPASAQAPPTEKAAEEPPPLTPEDEALARAKRLFFEGNELRLAGDCHGALPFFLDSRAAVPSIANTLNAAICMNELGRDDEALELYEELLTRFREQLSESDKAAIVPETARLRSVLGSVDVVSKDNGQLVLDGRPRGQLPLLTPIRARPGKHELVVVRDGYESFATTVEVTAQEATRVSVSLVPLRISGRLRVEGEPGVELFVDGARLGTLPWEGALAPGDHAVWVTSKDKGTAPSKLTIVNGQVALLRPMPLPLGPEIVIVASPASTHLRIGEVEISGGRFRGRLPIGRHHVLATETGYFTLDQYLDIDAKGPTELPIRMRVDPNHPRWGSKRPPIGSVWIEALGGVAVGASLDSDAESACTRDPRFSCGEAGPAWGPLVGARVGYEHPSRVSVALMGGYIRLSQSVTRNFDSSYGPGITSRYDLEDELTFPTPLVAVGAGYRHPLGGSLELGARLFVGAAFPRSSDTIGGTITAKGRSVPIHTAEADGPTTVADVFVAPEVSLGLRLEDFRVGLGLGVYAFLLDGPPTGNGDLFPLEPGRCSEDNAECAPGSSAVADESAHGQVVTFAPTLSLGYAFSL